MEAEQGSDWVDWDDDGLEVGAGSKLLEEALSDPRRRDVWSHVRPDEWLAFRLFRDDSIQGFLVRPPDGESAIFSLFLDEQEYDVDDLECIAGGDEYFAFTTKEEFTRLAVRRGPELLAVINRPWHHLPLGLTQRHYPALDRQLPILDLSGSSELRWV